MFSHRCQQLNFNGCRRVHIYIYIYRGVGLALAREQGCGMDPNLAQQSKENVYCYKFRSHYWAQKGCSTKHYYGHHSQFSRENTFFYVTKQYQKYFIPHHKHYGW